MSDQIENHIFKIDGCLEIGNPAYSYDVAVARTKRDFPRARSIDYLGVRELRTLESRKQPVSAEEFRPVVVNLRPASSRPVAATPARPVHKGMTMKELEDSVIGAYGGHV